MEKLLFLYIAGRHGKWCNFYGKHYNGASKNYKYIYDPGILLLGIYPKELKAGTQTSTCTLMFTATLFMTIKWWKQLK